VAIAHQICVLTAFSVVARESFDAQMLFDPLEEQLYLPAAFIECCDGQGRQGSVIG
jgi:hypothetical protein